MKGTDFVLLISTGLSIAGWHPALAEVVEPDGYRMEAYRAPVPATLEGARVVTTREAAVLWRAGEAVFFDVMPRAPKPEGLPEGTIWRDKVRMDIPGSTWLPNVGYGVLNAETEGYFRAGLEEMAGNDKGRPILFYCMIDCWMSWNAARRAMEFGHTNVIWYPFGADGWEGEGLPLVEASPYSMTTIAN